MRNARRNVGTPRRIHHSGNRLSPRLGGTGTDGGNEIAKENIAATAE